MGNIESEKWKRQEILNSDWRDDDFYYFKREMNAGRSCIKSYFSHIFIQICQSQSEMENRWKKTNHYIALKYQSKVQEVIEKSNFYLCLFVKEQISVKVRNEIESDSFCAKKYIFENNGKILPEMLEDIENKIFRMNCQIPFKEFPKLKSMELQNFRGYAGNFSIDFRDSREKPASVVVIYAKNGVGKTSLFDGVEYALKGEVGRIISLIAKDKYNKQKGAVYHNRDNADKDAFVLMTLEGDIPILRKVAKVAEGGNDCVIKPALKGKEITGMSKDKDRWDRIVLPHDKIDSFISARSSTEQYKEWTKTVGLLSEETEEFENAYNEYRDAQRKLGKLKEKYEEIENKLKSLSGAQSAVKNLIEIIQLYNKVAEEGQALFFTNEADLELYDTMINQTKKYSRELETKKKSLEEKISLAEEVLNKGVSSCQNIISSIDEISESIKKLELQIQRKQELDALLQTDKENLSVVVTYQKEVDFLQKIGAYGVENTKGKCKEYLDIGIKIDELENSLKYFELNLKSAIEEISEAELNISKYKSTQLSEEDYEQALNKAKELDEKNEKLVKIQAEYKAAKEQGEQYEKLIASTKEMIEDVTGFQLPKDVMELKSGEVNVRILLDDAKQKQLYDFEDRYRKVSMQMQVCQEEISKQAKTAEELKEICQKGREYLNLHRNTNECPLCHTPFDDWETLFLRINNIQEQNEDSLKGRLGKYHAALNQISDEYESFNLQCEELKEKRLGAYKKTMERLIEESHSGERAKEKCEKRENTLNDERRVLELWFIQRGIQLSEFSSGGLEVWRKSQEELLSQCWEELNGYLERKEAAKTSADSTRTVLAALKEQKDKLVRDSELYSYIQFWMKQPDSFNFSKYLQEQENLLKTCKDKQKTLQEKIKTYKDVENMEMAAYTDSRDKQLNDLEQLKNLKEKYGIFEDFSEEGITKSLNIWLQQKENYEKQCEYLNQISEENSARSYFESYKVYCRELQDKEGECLKQEKVIEVEKKDFAEKKKNLEIGLKSYFNRTIMNEIFRKIDPHDFMKNVEYDLSFNERNEPQLHIRVCEGDGEQADSYRPELYFSTAQLNTVAFSSFFSRALTAENIDFRTIFIDDPIGHFDDMNILGFTDLIRSILETIDCQIIMSTHDEKIFKILERKLNSDYYSSCFIRLPESDAVTWSV
jgi:exonuclease SbcC